MKFAVIRFPGSNCDQDCLHALRDDMGVPTDYVWHKETSLDGYDAIVVPGGFSYGDYLRTGAIARFSPVMGAVQDAQRKRANWSSACATASRFSAKAACCPAR